MKRGDSTDALPKGTLNVHPESGSDLFCKAQIQSVQEFALTDKLRSAEEIPLKGDGQQQQQQQQQRSFSLAAIII